jgi:uncharacterized membrane protein SpoIIM required for sporulation
MGDPYARHRPAWQELEQLLLQTHTRGLASLTFDQTERLGVTYRLATAHLARYRQQGRDPQIVSYLNDLAIRAHGTLYRPTRERLDPVGFFRERFPATFRSTWRYQAAAWTLTLSAGLVTFAAVALDRELAYSLIPPFFLPRDALHAIMLDPAAQEAMLTYGQDQGAGEKSFFASFLMVNNTRVGLMAFVSGALAGVPTIALLLLNGVVLGAFFAVFWVDGGLHPLFLPWILPHGVTELLAVHVAAAAGLYLGAGVVDPGRLPRRDALRLRARVALRLAIGTLPMFVLAGLVESFLRQSHLPTWARLTFAALTVVGWIAYLGFAGRRRDVLT